MLSGLPLSQEGDDAAMVAIPEADLDPVHMIQWERDIFWDDADDSNDAPTSLRGDAQNGAAGAVDQDDWDDLDRALNMDLDSPKAQRHGGQLHAGQLQMPLLEPLPQRPKQGTVIIITCIRYFCPSFMPAS